MHRFQCPLLEFSHSILLGLLTLTVEDLMQSSAQFEDGRYKCMICEKQLSRRKDHMRRHMRNIHISSPIDYQCPLCKKNMWSRNAIYNHVRLFHKGWDGINYDSFIVKSQSIMKAIVPLEMLGNKWNHQIYGLTSDDFKFLDLTLQHHSPIIDDCQGYCCNIQSVISNLTCFFVVHLHLQTT